MKNLIIERVKNYLSGIRYRRILPGILIGGLAGFLYYYFVGCQSGSCPITGHSYSSVLAGGLMGYLVSDIVQK
jgi:hypothetical protein